MGEPDAPTRRARGTRNRRPTSHGPAASLLTRRRELGCAERCERAASWATAKMSAQPQRKERGAAPRHTHTHSCAIRTRRGRTLVAQHIGSSPGATRCEYDITTMPTSHGLLPMSPLAMLSDRGLHAATPPNVQWLLQSQRLDKMSSPQPTQRSPLTER